jgi:hypothetical protein
VHLSLSLFCCFPVACCICENGINMSAVGKMVSKMRKKQVIKVTHPPYLKVCCAIYCCYNNIYRRQSKRAWRVQRRHSVLSWARGASTSHNSVKTSTNQRIILSQVCCCVYILQVISGVPLPTLITVNSDRSYKMDIRTPTAVWLIMHAAGIRRGSENNSSFHLFLNL